MQQKAPLGLAIYFAIYDSVDRSQHLVGVWQYGTIGGSAVEIAYKFPLVTLGDISVLEEPIGFRKAAAKRPTGTPMALAFLVPMLIGRLTRAATAFLHTAT